MDKIIINTETLEVTTEEFTVEEIALRQKEAERIQKEIEASEKIKAEAAAKRQVLLDKLGITEEEAKLLLG
jgi:PAB1-binding protein PBP1